MTQEPASPVRDRILSALGMNAAYVLDVLSLYEVSPQMVTAEWRRYFEGLERGEISPAQVPASGDRSLPVSGGGTTGVSELPTSVPTAPPGVPEEGEAVPLVGGQSLIVGNMEASRSVPTATSYRQVAVKTLDENRRLLNHYLELASRGKISFTHIIAWAVVRALDAVPSINDAFLVTDGKPHRLRRKHVRLGVAVDLERKDGSRNLLVPNISDAGNLGFKQFVKAYNRVIKQIRSGQLDPEAFQGTTITLTNPGTVGTEMSVPRLMPGQGAIIAVGSIGYSAGTRAMSPEILSRLGISKQMTISCTYDHRIIQGAVSGQYLAEVERLLMGENDFYDQVFEAMGVPHHPVRWTPDLAPSGMGEGGQVDEITRQARVLQLINAYRVRGHLIADLDALKENPQYHPELDIQHYGLTLWDLDRSFITGATASTTGATASTTAGASAWEEPQSTLREILETVRAAYCGKIGVEYMNIQDPEQKRWIQQHVESEESRQPLPADTRQHILETLLGSETFERFLHTKYMGHKRFSLEGGETLIPILEFLLEEAGAGGVEEVVMGMAHRGRLNVLTQTVGLDPARLFAEFQGNRDPYATQGSGDVKYHLGATGTHECANGRAVRISLSPNPSHLEAVDPVVEGITRAKQERMGAEEGRRRVLPVLIHGDAAFAGQGVVAETLNLSQLHGYRTGGTVHIVVNNQIGFTTPVESARSSPYPTDVAKMCQAPIFHVNGDDPEAAVRVVRWALAYRQTFERDVVIDMFCYRRHGHNEGDEPSYTQPRLYARIKKHPSVATQYTDRLVRDKVLTREEVGARLAEIRGKLDTTFEASRKEESRPLRPGPIHRKDAPSTQARTDGADGEMLTRVGEALVDLPPELDIHPKLGKWMDARREMIAGKRNLDWSFAEALAFGSLVLEGVPVRLSGQDSVRGTFSQRHLLFRDDDTGTGWMALRHISPNQAPFMAVDSPLSEESVLGFEYGYSIGDPRALVLWEAQFGDFINEAQVAVDQFIAGSEAKWGQPSGVALLLPHGYEGQGPDHSSARMERFLQLCAEENLRIANVTTPAQYFHLLRRQGLGSARKPLVVFTPKSLLRHPRAGSPWKDLISGGFRPFLGDASVGGAKKVRRVLLCSGKIYYDLEAAREESGISNVAVCRVEELYPFPESDLQEAVSRFRGAELCWVQEEPRNMGAWMFIRDRLERMDLKIQYVGRAESASTASGYHEVHAREQKRLIEDALRF